MADPVPAANAALLAAQAQAGQAGVDAYKAAQESLAAQRQQAVTQAMQEAALRGAPTGAMQSLQGQMTAPYDQRIASLSQASAAYQADMSARDRRMADYNAAVNAARSYIPQQVELAVAPIRARGEYDVRQQQIRGDQAVSEIGANLRLTEAKMAAAAQAYRINEAKKKAEEEAEAAKLSQGELSSMLPMGAQQRINDVGERLKQYIVGNKQETLAEAQTRLGRSSGAERALERERQIIEQARTPTTGRNYFDVLRGTASNAPKTLGPVAPRRVGQAAVSSGWDALRGGVFGGAPRADRTPPLPMTTNYFDVLRGTGRAVPTTRTGTGVRANTTSLAQQVAQARVARQADVQAINAREASAMEDILSRHRTPGLGYIMPEQLAGWDPYDAQIALNAPGFLGDTAAVDRYIFGAPWEGQGFAGQSDPYSVQIMRDALGRSADDLQAQGYDFDYPDFINAIGNKGQSLFNMRAEELGQPSTEDVYKRQTDEREEAIRAAEKAEQEGWDTLWNDRRDAEWLQTHDPATGAPLPSAGELRAGASADRTAANDQRQAQLDQYFSQGWDMGPPDGMSDETAFNLTQSDEFGVAEEGIKATPEYQAKGFLTPDEFSNALVALRGSVNLTPGAIRLLRHFYQQSVSSDWTYEMPEG